MANTQDRVNPYQTPVASEHRGHLFLVAIIVSGAGFVLMAILSAGSLWMAFYGYNRNFWFEQFYVAVAGIVLSLVGIALGEIGRRRHLRRRHRGAA